MKVMIAYPPFKDARETPILSQNRQFRWFTDPSYIYPIVPAYAATMLKNAGHHVIWNDGIAEREKYYDWLRKLEQDVPEMIAMETKTPVVKRHWKIIDDIKGIDPDINVVLMGDHVTALPKESMEKSKVDYVLTGGDYDFLLLNLVKHLEGRERLEPGIWFRDNGRTRSSGKFEAYHDLNDLPFIDRELTKWWLYSETVGNYVKTPGTYTMVGRDCWHHGCTFCSWSSILYTSFRVRTPGSLLNEVGMLINRYGVKEIMDDTGTFPVGSWLKRFCQGMINRGYNKEVIMDCNMRFGALTYDEYRLMREAGFRFVLFGLESANQKTLDRINKALYVEDIVDSCKKAKEAGLSPHITVMFGYPWETKEDAERTLGLAHYLLKKGYADTVQATLVIPYPGTPLFEEVERNGYLKTLDWNRYDMREPVMRTPMLDYQIIEMIERTYRIAFDPEFVIRKIIGIRGFGDIKFILRAAKKVLSHIRDNSRTRETLLKYTHTRNS